MHLFASFVSKEVAIYWTCIVTLLPHPDAWMVIEIKRRQAAAQSLLIDLYQDKSMWTETSGAMLAFQTFSFHLYALEIHWLPACVPQNFQLHIPSFINPPIIVQKYSSLGARQSIYQSGKQTINQWISLTEWPHGYQSACNNCFAK